MRVDARTPIITIDGPGASGKGTLARALAEKLGFYYLDTGAISRLLAVRLLSEGINPDDEAAASARALAFVPEFDPAHIADPAIRTDVVGQATSKSSRHAGVRGGLLEVQRILARYAKPI